MKKINDKEIKKRLGLTATLVLFVFVVTLLALIFALAVIVLLDFAGVIDVISLRQPTEHRGGGLGVLFMLITLSSISGIALSAFFSKKALKPIRRLIAATGKIAWGDFNVRVEPQGIRELEELSISFNKMAQELSSIETLRSDFINDFSHEFKTPIVSIRGFAKLLKEGGLSESEQQEYLGIIIDESERLSKLSTNVLNLSKYENTNIITEKVPFRLDEQIRKVVVLTEPKWSKKNIDINIDFNEVVFNGDENLLQQIWINLLDNAVKFSEQYGTIEMRLTDMNGKVCFSIQDNGEGMDEATRNHIFDKFYQGDKSRNQFGNGLGLPIVKRIVDLCGGTIDIESESGKGSTFTVTLPK